ncbi:MAG: histidine--tRNA ligase [Candidatus Eisenbacteria bacterium]|uniref:Histidine--tRNA ligase n=1 Tax=Eiseniibacteriota bacterium TaxID=2212470 RepID=A0A956LWG2_UNCEI|nr:histidine--tRNA ligase [Candidatus Eisenbacteria bacterium]
MKESKFMERITPRTFKGTRDLLPVDMIRREELFDYVRRVYRRYGFLPLETPAVEYLDVLLGKYGTEGEKLLYRLDYKGGHVLALRYDLTVPLARVVAQHADLPKPFKRYQMQPVWRADSPQLRQGRYREFYQCDADIVGEEDRIADAEILAVIAELVDGLGMGTFHVRVNHRKILEGMVAAAGLPADAGPAVLRAIDKIDKVGEKGIESELEREGVPTEARRVLLDLLQHPSGGAAEIESLRDRLPDQPAIAEGCADLLRIWSCLDALGSGLEPYQFRLGLARGLDYYTGAVYEAFTDALPHMGSLAGGGRYDGLIAIFSGQDVAAVGATVGMDRILTALDQLGLNPPRSSVTEVMVLQWGEGSEPAALAMTGRLRRAGISTEIGYRSGKLGKQIGGVSKRGIPLVLFQGPEEAERGEWSLKVLSSGEQHTVAERDVETVVRRQIEAIAAEGSAR